MRLGVRSMVNPDELCLRRARAGDRESLAALWESERGWVAAVLLAHMPRGAELDDLLQEVAVALVRGLPALSHGAAFRPWLRTVAQNAARTAGRRHQARTARVDGLDLDALPGAAAAPETVLHLGEVLARLHDLPLELREPLLLRAVHGASQREIAALLELPETTVETRLARARRALRRQVTADDEDRLRRIS